MNALGICALLAATLAGCATSPRVQAGWLTLKCAQADATVWIDDVYGGTARIWEKPRSVRAGFHRVELRLPDHFGHFAEVTVPADSTISLSVTLHPHLD